MGQKISAKVILFLSNTMPFAADHNVIQISIPFKHPKDTYMFTYNIEFPGSLTIEVISSQVRMHMITPAKQETVIKKQENLPTVILLVFSKPNNHSTHECKGKKHVCEYGKLFFYFLSLDHYTI